MNPGLVLAAIRAAIRIGKTAADAYEQYAEERPVLLPDADRVQTTPAAEIVGIARNNPDFKAFLNSDPEMRRLWQNNMPVATIDGAEAAVYAVACSYVKRREGVASELSAQTDSEFAGGMMVAQWAKGKGPVSPWARIIVAMTDVALEYVGSNPQVLGIGGNGEKLVGAMAQALSEVIPDSADRNALGPKERFGERIAALVLHAGLKTITEKPDLVFGEEHLQELLRNSLPPVIDALPGDSVAKQVEWRKVADAFIGPAVGAAIETIADTPSAFLGDKYKAEKAAGVMVSGLLTAFTDVDVKKRFTKETAFILFKTAVGVAAENPELVLGDLLDKDLSDPANREKADAIILNLFKEVTGALKDRKPPYTDEIGPAIAIAAIEGLKKSGPVMFKQSNSWRKLVGDMTNAVLNGFTEALGDDAKTLEDTVFTKQKLIELGRTVLTQVSATPHMLIDDKEEVERIVSAVSQAMAADEKLLLTADDWIRIAGVAAQEAASNPKRLFGINDKSIGGKLAVDIIGRLLKAAGDDFSRTDREVGPVMIGETLRDSIIFTLRAISGNVVQAFEQRAKIEDLAAKLNEAVGARGLTMGGKEWKRLFNQLLPQVLAKGEVPALTDTTIASLLAAKA